MCEPVPSAGLYDFYEKEQALFRGPAGAAFVTEVRWPGGQWVSYSGDRRAPVVFGNVIKLAARDPS